MVKKIKNLGVYLNRKKNNKDQIENRIKSACKTMASIKYLQTENQHLNVNIKIHIYKVFVRPVLIYGLENYALKNARSTALYASNETCSIIENNE
ncbi:hypothetical protein BpHYR1_042803 [Brachionus plicatilis]|uniref:RNA-directed DNA polymerase from mobile element jockey-like n=1 Tax=Brachionus plicatilis TaxID=10195 RepID=A0A3M7SPY9_BRAPC|nr:hypothetical protein BpHYR1_042803 [Brachionus plicatilis]